MKYNNTTQAYRLVLRLWLGFVLTVFGTIAGAQSPANLESPSPDAFIESGVGLIRGWACQAERIEVSINDEPPRTVAYGTRRTDTTAVCGHPNTGFGLTFPWYALGDGVHNLRAFADGVEFANVNFAVTTLRGREFLTGLGGEYTLRDFPSRGSSPRVRWSEPHQNFVFARAVPIPPAPPVPPHPLRAALESPIQGSFESGIGLIRGWVCEAERIAVSINGEAPRAIAYGARRADTTAVCGHPNTGFGLTFPWYALGDGVHNLRAFADDVEFANVNFAVTTLGGRREFLTGLSRKQTLDNFPRAGQTAEVRWSEPHQNFIVAQSTATGSKIGILSAITDRVNRFAGVLAGSEAQADAIGMQATRTPSGEPKQVTGFAWTAPDGVSADLELAADGLPAVYRDSDGTEARLSALTETTVTVGFFRDGQAVGSPVPVSINGGFLRTLQDFVNQFRNGVQSVDDPSPDGLRRAAVEPMDARAANIASQRFSLNRQFVDTQLAGSVATGETLCAVQRAAAQTPGLLARIAERACRSPLVDSLLNLARTPSRLASTASDELYPGMRERMRFEEDVAEAPCGPTDPSAACLTAAAEELQERVEEAGAPIPPEEPASPPPVIYVVSAVADLGGSVTPAVQTVAAGATASVTVVPDSGYQIDSVTGCGGALDGNTYTTGPIAADCTVNALFSRPYYEVTTVAGPGGSINPVRQLVPAGETARVTVTPNSGYQIAAVTGCGGSLNGTTYTTGPIAAACTVTASFSLVPPTTYLVTATAGPGGNISPPSQTVAAGATASVTVVPDSGYQIDSVTGCGGALDGNTYTTGPIAGTCTVSASFSLRPPPTYTVTAVAGPGGSIAPTAQTVAAGATASVTVLPDSGYQIASVTGCGGGLNGNTYVTGLIAANCTVSASFIAITISVTLEGPLTAQVGIQYIGLFQATGGASPYSWRIDAPSALPASLTLNPSTGALTGTPTTAEIGTYNFMIRATDTNGIFKVQSFTITVENSVSTARCPQSYSPPGNWEGNIGRVAVYNEWTQPIRVSLYHPDGGGLFTVQEIPPGVNNFIGDFYVGDDWGICLESPEIPRSGVVRLIGDVANFEVWNNINLFMVLNPNFK